MIFCYCKQVLEINEISQSMCLTICIDGAPPLLVQRKVLSSKVLKVFLNIMFNHCIIHREMLASKNLQPDVNKILYNAISAINVI